MRIIDHLTNFDYGMLGILFVATILIFRMILRGNGEKDSDEKEKEEDEKT